MATELKLPDLGEGIEDVTINRWLKQEGDDVNEGDILLEVATDKVDTEVPSPVSGKLLKINFREGELVATDAALAVIGAEGETASQDDGDRGAAQAEEAAPGASAPSATPAPTAVTPSTNGHEPGVAVGDADGENVRATPVARRIAVDKGIALNIITGTGPNGQITKEDVLAHAQQSSAATEGEALPGELADVPTLAVRRLAAEHNIDLEEIADGTPLSALTKYDVLSAIASREAGEKVVVQPKFAPPQAKEQTPPVQAAAPEPKQAAPAPVEKPAAAPAPTAGAGEELIKLSRMRQLVGKNTKESYLTAPHVTTWHDVDMTAVLQHRKANKKAFDAQGVNLTVTAYLVEAIMAGLKAVPAANATWTEEGVIIKRYYNIGMAVALPMDQYGMGGLIVPVIKNVGDLNLVGIARQVNELATKARDNKLQAQDLQGGTFTVSNYGTSGSRFQTPVIVQPQVAILGTGVVEKRPVIVSNGHPLEPNMGDYMAFKPMMTIALSYDHRVLDGATADAFCVAFKKALESYK